MELSREWDSSVGWLYHTGPKWTMKTHYGRIGITKLGRYAVYARSGSHLGTFKDLRSARGMLK